MKRILFCTLAALTALALLASGASAAKAWDYWIATTASCNVRTWADLDADVVTTLPAHDMAYFEGDMYLDDRGVMWYYISTYSGDGWVSSKYAQLNSDMGTSFDGASFYRLSGVRRVVASGDCNVRRMPELNGYIVGTLRKGTKSIYAGMSYRDDRGVRWDFVEFEDSADGEGKDGWVSSKYTRTE